MLSVTLSYYLYKQLSVYFHDVVPCTSGRNLDYVQGTTYNNMTNGFSWLQGKKTKILLGLLQIKCMLP